MKKFIALIAALFSFTTSSGKSYSKSDFQLDYDQLITLDAEALAEGGIKTAYEKLIPVFKKYVSAPGEIREELIDGDNPSYRISYAGVTYKIYSPDDENESWGRATHALFDIVNRQLKNSKFKFYAINGGNDLGGMFLTEEQAHAARASLKRKTDWPYLPTLSDSWYGQHH
jgi:hypothetical protein